ncbi:hypothetical protein GGI07_001515 [Coemansia sp. Benny D115]|nr:hypothetical protein GGI07_001515 [Coemansia sp. Benny D115]
MSIRANSRIYKASPIHIALVATAMLTNNVRNVRGSLEFVYSCFLKPLGQHSDQQSRLNAFYQGQASSYDATRGGLLRGRRTMLKLCAAELNAQKSSNLVWVDIGGGTGWNIEEMDKYLDIRRFKAIYLVDLCQPLCEVAKRRFMTKGWSNVFVVCQDAASFTLSELGNDANQVDLVTMSYSLSMIDKYYAVVDRVKGLLRAQTGLLGVADFYVSDQSSTKGSAVQNAGDIGYACNWFTRVFWQHWFELDHVYLHPCRRSYLEHSMGTVKVYNGRNHFLVPYVIQIPYYVWIGRAANQVAHLGDVARVDPLGIQIPPRNPASLHQFTPESSPKCCFDSDSDASQAGCCLPDLSLEENRCSQVPESALHRGWQRIPYSPNRPEHTQFSTYIYGFTWEDPLCDIKALDLQPDDRILAITSAGDNILAYAAHQKGVEIHCVDMNPCQNHLLELKLAALHSLDYQTVWSMFGKGHYRDFAHILDSVLSASLSPHAYQYWRKNVSAFDPRESSLARKLFGDMAHQNFYTTGYSGTALYCLRLVLKILGLHNATQELTKCKIIESQAHIWNSKIRKHIVNGPAVHLLDNPVAMWQLMGVPINQWNMLHSEGSMSQYIRDTLDPVATNTAFARTNYFYHLLFTRQYSPDCCPDYLTISGFEKLKKLVNSNSPSFYLHTSTILNVLADMADGELTKAVIMDHMDWFSGEEADLEVKALSRVIRKGGFVLWRSAARIPWYISIFEANGFVVEAISVRQPNMVLPLDRVNMYASFYKAVKT